MALGRTPSSIPDSTADDDWSAKATDVIVEQIDKVRDATVGPATKVAKGLVYGLIAVVVGILCLVLLVIGLIRGLDLLLPGSVWSAYLLLGVIFTAVGTVLWTRRT